MYLRCYDGLNVDVIDKNALSFIMGKGVAMETFVTSTVSFRLFRYLTSTFMCVPYTCVQTLSKLDLDLKTFDLQRLERSLNQGQI